MHTLDDDLADRAELPGPDALPARADVVVIGGGLAGAAVAWYLAERGTDVILLEGRDDVGLGASGRAPGHVTTGLVEHPYRVRIALGDARARALFELSRENHRLLDALGLLRRTGGWWVATDRREPTEIADSARALEALGVPVELRDDADASLGGSGFTAAMRLPEDGFLAPDAVGTLCRRAVARGARCVVRAPVQRVRVDGRGAVVETTGREIVAEVVVFAANARLPSVEPWFVDKVVPYREQALLTAPIAPLPHPGARASYGSTVWRQRDDGRLVAAGCRWATPHGETGETEEIVVDRIQGRVERFVARHLGVDAPIERRWSWIDANGCDGLPIVGPLPGSPRLIACAAFCGNEPGLAVRAARAVASGLLDGGGGLPDFLAASRFL